MAVVGMLAKGWAYTAIAMVCFGGVMAGIFVSLALLGGFWILLRKW